MVPFCKKIIGAVILVLLPGYGLADSSIPRALVKIRNVEISVEIPDTPSLTYKGLGRRNYLPEFAGMLFIFPEADFYTFHMKGMRFPIDIIWIRSHVIIDISPNVPVSAGPNHPTYHPGTEADMVLEVNAHFTRRHNIRVGDRVEILSPVKGK